MSNHVHEPDWPSDADPTRRRRLGPARDRRGTAGLVAAKTAAGFGAQVLLVERSRTGGDCLWTGCVPSKALLSAAHARAASSHGVIEPPIPGLAEANPWTSETIWSLDALPARLLVLGGGSIGCELGQAFARIGSSVAIVEAAPRLLPVEDGDAAALVTDALLADGITVRTDAGLTDIVWRGPGWCATLADGSKLDFDDALVAVGRTPHSAGLGLDAAGVVVPTSTAGPSGTAAGSRTAPSSLQ